MTIASFSQAGRGDGFISIWSGSIASIPAGWALCDGNNGTPDLRGRFVKGTSNPGTDPGTTAGQDSLTLTEAQLPSHTHPTTTDQSGTHTHSFWNSWYMVGSLNPSSNSLKDVATNSGDGVFHTGLGGAHNHTATMDAAGSGASIENRPTYYEVAYIMLL